MPENGARRRGSADADRSPGRLRGSNARRGEGKETERVPGASREEERRRDVQAGVYSSPEPRSGHERRRRIALGGWRSPEQGGEGSEHAHEKRRARCSRARQRTEEREARVNGSVCWWQYITGADARTHRKGVDEYPCAGAGLVQDPVGEARGRQEREINRRRGEEERCWREVSPGKDSGSDKGRGREDHERRGAGGRGRRCEGESLERKEWREKMRRSDEELREEKEHEYSEEEDYGYDLERRRRGKPEWREKKSCPEEREGYRGRREGRMEPGAGVREKQDLSGQRKRGDKQHMRREGMRKYETESGEEEESDRRARHGSRQRKESWEEYIPGRREGLRSRQEERREFREREDQQQRERRKREGRFQDYSPERRERRWGEAGGRREAHEEEQRRSPSPRGPRRPRQTGEGSSEARGAREGIDRVLDGRRKQVSKVGAWVCVQVTPETEEKDKKVGAWADEPVAVGAEGKDEKVGAWAAAEGEEKDEKEGAGACELVAAGAEEKDEQVGAWECAPAAAEAEEKDEQVGAWVCAPAAAEAEEKDEQVGAGACVTAAADAEEKDEKVGAGVCVTAAAKAEEKEEQVGAGACVPAVAEAERKDEKVGARPCVLKAEKQVQGSMRAEQHVRKLREERPELLGEKMVKEAVRGAETGVRSIKVGMACDWGTGDLREAEEAVKTVRWIKGGTWADEPMRLASQVLSESRGMEEAEKWAAWEGGKAVGHLKEVILALVEDLHVVQMGDACSYEQWQQLGGRGTEEAVGAGQTETDKGGQQKRGRVQAGRTTSFPRSSLQPLIPLLKNVPPEAYTALPFLFSLAIVNPIRIASGGLPLDASPLDRLEKLRDNLLGLLPSLPKLRDNLLGLLPSLPVSMPPLPKLRDNLLGLLPSLPVSLHSAGAFLLDTFPLDTFPLEPSPLDASPLDASPLDRLEKLRDNLLSLLPSLPLLTELLPQATLEWKLHLLETGSAFTEPLLPSIRAPTLIIAGSDDQLLPSKEESGRLQEILTRAKARTVVRVFEGSGHALLLMSQNTPHVKGGVLIETSQNTPHVKGGVLIETSQNTPHVKGGVLIEMSQNTPHVKGGVLIEMSQNTPHVKGGVLIETSQNTPHVKGGVLIEMSQNTPHVKGGVLIETSQNTPHVKGGESGLDIASTIKGAHMYESGPDLAFTIEGAHMYMGVRGEALYESGFDLASTIKGAHMYIQRRGDDPVVSGFQPPTVQELARAKSGLDGFLRRFCSPVFLSTVLEESPSNAIAASESSSNGGRHNGTANKEASNGAASNGAASNGAANNGAVSNGAAINRASELMAHGVVVRGLAHPLAIEMFHDINMLVEQGEQYKVFGAVPVTPANTYKVLANKEAALLFPGGVREALKKRGEDYQLFWPERAEFVRMAAKHEATIIPFACIGVDDGFDILVDADEMPSVPVIGPMAVEGVQAWPRVSVTIIGPMAVEGVQSWPRVRDAAAAGAAAEQFIPPVVVPKGLNRLYFLFGAPIRTKGMKHLLTDKAAAAELYAHVKGEVEGGLQYLLKKREEDPYNDPVPRLLYEATWGGEKQAPTFKP
ncbi:unnamed protein product [Closterium sp. NIES-64]|nr:unnamed protein product [Closterium sp. NIES-64]